MLEAGETSTTTNQPLRLPCQFSGVQSLRLPNHSLVGGFSPTHLKKYAEVKLDHETPGIRDENKIKTTTYQHHLRGANMTLRLLRGG